LKKFSLNEKYYVFWKVLRFCGNWTYYIPNLVLRHIFQVNWNTIFSNIWFIRITSKNKWGIDTAVKEMETAFGSVSVNRGKLQKYDQIFGIAADIYGS